MMKTIDKKYSMILNALSSEIGTLYHRVVKEIFEQMEYGNVDILNQDEFYVAKFANEESLFMAESDTFSSLKFFRGSPSEGIRVIDFMSSPNRNSMGFTIGGYQKPTASYFICDDTTEREYKKVFLDENSQVSRVVYLNYERHLWLYNPSDYSDPQELIANMVQIYKSIVSNLPFTVPPLEGNTIL